MGMTTRILLSTVTCLLLSLPGLAGDRRWAGERVIDITDGSADAVSSWYTGDWTDTLICYHDITGLTGTSLKVKHEMCVKEFGTGACSTDVVTTDALQYTETAAITAPESQITILDREDVALIQNVKSEFRGPVPPQWRIMIDVTSVSDVDITVDCWWK